MNRNEYHIMTRHHPKNDVLGICLFLWLGVLPQLVQAENPQRFGTIRPTVLCPRESDDPAPKRLVNVAIVNDTDAVPLRLRVTMEHQAAREVDLGVVGRGTIVKPVAVPDLAATVTAEFQLLPANSDTVLDVRKEVIPTARKWKIYCVSYSHHDMGYADFYQRIQRDIRLGGIERAFEYCRQTDDWAMPDKFRWLVETSVPMPQFVEHFPSAVVDELVRRVAEGRIEWGACHNTASPDMMATELVARLFYTPNRHGRDMLGIDFSRVGVISDVVGLPWGFATFTKEADLPYFFFSPNRLARCLEPAFHTPVFYWQSPDGDSSRTLFRVIPYDYPHPGSLTDFTPESIQAFVARYEDHQKLGLDCMVSVDTNDFTVPSLHYASNIRQWNARWRSPQLVCATMKMFFDDVAAQIGDAEVPTFAKDATSAWADQELSDARLIGQARILGPRLTATETFATIASVAGGGEYPWEDLWQAYNRLLMYHEHTNGADAGNPRAIGTGKDAYPEYYETEQTMHRALVEESQEYCNRAAETAFSKLQRLITREHDATLIVFNPLCCRRTDIVRAKFSSLPQTLRVVETSSGRDVEYQRLADGDLIFLARDVPALGYRTYAVLPANSPPESQLAVTVQSNILENRYYRVVFDSSTGGIASVWDKELNVELVDGQAPYRFNEYLYQKSVPERGKLQWQNDKSASLAGRAGPVLGWVTAQVKAHGCRNLRQTVTLYTDVKRIDFLQELDKTPSGITLPEYQNYAWHGREAVYFALPLRIPDFSIRHDTPGAVIEPIVDQFPGASTAYYAVQRFTDLSNKDYGVTVAACESPVVEYGRPRAATWLMDSTAKYESELKYPGRSHLFFYVMNNFFPVNARCDQRGRADFRWSMRSHRGDWRKGSASEFGEETSHPLIARFVRGTNRGCLPADAHSFLSINHRNVSCTTVKMAEANGEGIGIRLNEREGLGGPVTVACPFMPRIARAIETNLIEDDRAVEIPIHDDNQFTVEMRPFGVKTIRLLAGVRTPLPRITGMRGEAKSDMQVDLHWQAEYGDATPGRYTIYRGTMPSFPLTMRYYVGSTAEPHWTDYPRRCVGGWISNCLAPDTTYYYRIVAVDPYNRRGPSSAAVAVHTRSAEQGNRRPEQVKGLHVVPVSPLQSCNFLTLWFYSNIEPDVTGYEIHRAETPDFSAVDATRIGKIDLAVQIQYDTLWGVPMRNPLREYDRQMFRDATVQPGKTYCYRVCAVDAAGQRGGYSECVCGRTKEP